MGIKRFVKFFLSSVLVVTAFCLLGTRLVLADWSSFTNISNNSGLSVYSSIVADSSGVFHTVWCDNTGGSYEVYYSYKNVGQSWSQPVNLFQSLTNCSSPSLSVSSSDTLNLIWEDSTSGSPHAYYAYKSSGGSWSSSTDVSGSYGGYTPELVTDSSGTLHAVWYNAGDHYAYYSYKPVNGSWSSPSQIYSGLGSFTSLTIDSNDTLHMAWQVADHNSTSTNIYHLSKASGGSWSSAEVVSDCTGSTECSHASVVASGTTLYSIWSKTSNFPSDWNMYYSIKTSGGSWSTPTLLYGNTMNDFSYTQFAVDSQGVVHAAWQDDSSGNHEIYYSAYKNGSWVTPVNISNTSANSYYPSITTFNNLSYIDWAETTDVNPPYNNEIYFKGELPTVGQQVTYYNSNDGTNFSRSTSPFASGVSTQSVNQDGTVTVSVTSSSGYADSGFSLYEGRLGDLPTFTVNGTGDNFSLNLWFDKGGNNEYFAWSSGGVLTGLDGDTYGLGPTSSNGLMTVSGSSQFYLMSDGQNHSLSDLKSGAVSGITSDTKVAVWIGVSTGSGSTSSTITSITGL